MPVKPMPASAPSSAPPPAPSASAPPRAPRRGRRQLIQLLAALLYNLNLPGFASASIYQGPLKALCVPGLNCYSCPGAIGACPIGSLQAALAAADRKLPFYIVGTLLAFGAVFGRTICGWLCPFGLIQDLLDKIPLPKLRKGTWSRVASWGKYVVLAITVIGIPLALTLSNARPLPFFCAFLCPAGTLEAGIVLPAGREELRALLGWQFAWKFAVLLVLLVACLFIYRPFCRFLCPLGALYSFFNRIALLRYRLDLSRCAHCGACVQACKMDVGTVSDRECIQCGLCARHCEQQAISFTLTDMLSKRKGRGNVASSAPGTKGERYER
ncbi:MAG: 4Fe-4S binding protein [Coriobacteriales bacterium]|jgi:ferredoxin|nr:4Fe-4S binding protein [Coriobacteriales bacterium]